jgi:hypothetical protein
MSNRKLFIGSSSEALQIAQHIKTVLQDPANGLTHIDVDIWNDTDWANFETALTSLNNNIDEYYYAVFIGFPDSKLEETREDATNPGTFITKKYFAPRDNTIFEFGLFFSRLGKNRTFFLNPKDISGTDEFKILTDVGKSAYIIKYDIELVSGVWQLKTFNPSELLRFIKKEEVKFTKNINDSKSELKNLYQNLGSLIGATNKNDEYYLNKLKNGLDDLFYFKSKVLNIKINELADDILNVINDVNDFCKPVHLADKQSYLNGIRYVWVFSSKPFEFLTSTEDHILKIKQGVIDNLSNGVKYTYFVSHSDFKLSHIDNLISDKNSSLRDNIEIIFVESKLFKTFFTIHFKDLYALDSVYMSTLLKHRNDLMIQVTDQDHINRITERIQRLKGEHITSDKIKTVDYTVQ